MMGLFEKIFGSWPKKKPVQEAGIFTTLTAYNPAFTTFAGSIYEQELIRSVINALSIHSAKLDVSVNGPARPKLQTQFKKQPNSWQTWYRHASQEACELKCLQRLPERRRQRSRLARGV